MRFDFGTAGGIIPPPDRALTEFDSLDQVLFRVKVTCASGARQGVLLAAADQIPIRRPEDSDEERIPVFPVAPADPGHTAMTHAAPWPCYAAPSTAPATS